MYIQDLIKQKLDEAGINDYQLHQQTKIPYSSVRDFLRPSHKVDLVKLGLVCEVLGVEPWAAIREAAKQVELATPIFDQTAEELTAGLTIKGKGNE